MGNRGRSLVKKGMNEMKVATQSGPGSLQYSSVSASGKDSGITHYRGSANHLTKKGFTKKLRKALTQWQLYVLLLPALVYFVVFRYVPMYGVQLAFKDFWPNLGITGSPWVWFEHFERFFNSYQFESLLKNTLCLSLFQLAVSFPVPIVLAISINSLQSARFKRVVQTVTYAPYFISTVVLVGMINIFFSLNGGLVNTMIQAFGGDPVHFLGEEKWFRPLYVFSGVWQNMGWNTMIYIAALSGVNPELHEAAKIDGAGKLQRILHVDLPQITPTIVTLLILNVGKVMSVGFEKVYAMQNSMNLSVSEIISTYVYKVGLLDGQYGFSAAVDIFNAVINMILLITVNKLAKKMGGSSLW